ncbi:Hpt domain-containing protein [Candidatus Thiothrix sp. Deng01]|uniref:Hpt domain-containing protein n=1 Tax=Candidatus Thiothrix phosphatis TaxID=3112415 RepID=A0ABU6CY55_9GAMM|nr:Hpt domain-containing protein [Candidatus Thiothrix sp. Deng01]MEB4591007.1 Hpt domain-containing protein [Candidatus Thiothrix sp. Deng01]
MKLLAPEILQQLPAVILPRLVVMFGDGTPPILSEIRQYADAGDLHAMGKSAHKLKGSCVSLGAEHMAELCKQLQHKGENNDAEGVSDMLEELELLYPMTLEALQEAV